AHAVNRVADQLHVTLFKVARVARKLDELGAAYRGEIRRMRKQHDPLALGGVIAQLDHAVRALGLKIGCGLVDAGKTGWFGAHNSPRIPSIRYRRRDLVAEIETRSEAPGGFHQADSSQNHSYRSATMGSTLVARRAGI